MYRRAIIFSCLFVLGGCIYKDESVPQIVYNHSSSTSKLVLPKVVKPKPIRKQVNYNVPADWLPPSGAKKRWTAIVIHHSGTGNGNSAIFDKWHREGNKWDGVGYDFVIGNGTDSRDGQGEVTLPRPLFAFDKQRVVC